jgi:hypothetical protein
MAYYDKPKSNSIIYNDDNYISPGEFTGNSDNIDLSEYLRKSGDIMNGSLSAPDISIYNGGNIEFQTSTGNKLFTKDHITDIENNKNKLNNISSTFDNTTISNTLSCDKIVFPNLTEQVYAFNHIKQIDLNSTKLTQVAYDNGLTKTTFNNNVLINNLTCNNFNTSYLTTIDSDVQTQINLKQNIINDSSRLSALLVGTGKVSNTVYDYLIGVNNNIQSQLNGRQLLISAANRINALFIGTGNITNTILDYLSNVTSDVQDQINNITGLSSTNLLYVNNSSFTGSELNGVIFNTTNTFTKFIDPSSSTKLKKLNLYSISGALSISNLKFAQSITLQIRLYSNNTLITESFNNTIYSRFEYNGTNNSEFRTVSLIFSEFFFVAAANYSNIELEYYINYNVDAINAETVTFLGKGIIRKIN